MKKNELLKLYHEMVLIRQLEEKAAELYQQGKIGGFLHLYIGQEAVCSGVLSARRPEDRVITAYRDHGVAISAGMDPKVVMAELLGKATGCSKGKGGSMHMADVNLNFWGGHAIVGAHLPLAAGLALSDQYRGSDAVTICFFGDGATNIGYFHEALNLSKVWNLPVLWLCENNQYGMGTTIDRASAVSDIRQKAEGYGMASDCVNGMDVLAVRDVTLEALERVRKEGPLLLEAMTYRFSGHSMGDPERYREKEEVLRYREDDPIGIFRTRLLEDFNIKASDLDKEDKRVAGEIQEAVQFAESSPDPAPEALYEDLYTNVLE